LQLGFSQIGVNQIGIVQVAPHTASLFEDLDHRCGFGRVRLGYPKRDRPCRGNGQSHRQEASLWHACLEGSVEPF
jgi:hypothetical protein